MTNGNSWLYHSGVYLCKVWSVNRSANWLSQAGINIILNNYWLAITPNQREEREREKGERSVPRTMNKGNNRAGSHVAGMELIIQVCVSTEIRKVLEHEHMDYINKL